MGKKSVRENKNIYQTSRENCGLTREAAAEKLVFVSSDRIEKIEYETSAPHPEEVLAMAKGYGNAALCNYYCSHECPIGAQYVPAVEIKELSQITLEILSNLNMLRAEQEKLVEITVDGKISDDEMEDYLRIQRHLDQMSMTIDSLKLWVEQSLSNRE